MRKLLGVFTALLLLIPVVVVAAPDWVADLQSQIDALDARVAVLEGTSDTTTTTSTTEPPSTTSTTSSTSTSSTTTTTTEPPASTTTTEATTTSTSPVTTTTTGESQTFNLTADWLITDDSTLSNFHVEGNGHAVLIDGADVSWSDFTINNVERVMWHGACGVFALRDGLMTNVGGPNLGEYPLHQHLCGDTTRGSVVERVTVRNSVNRAFVPHGSHGITFLDVRAENIIRSAVWWDPPCTTDPCDSRLDRGSSITDNSNDILFDGLVVDGVSHPRTLEPCCSDFHTVSGAVLGAGSGNVMRNSVVRNVVGGSNCSGYFWREADNSNDGGNVWTFENNRVENIGSCHGIRVWQNDDNFHVIAGFSGGRISHGAYTNLYEYEGVDIPGLHVHAVGWTIRDSEVGDVTTLRHRFEGTVIFERVTMSSFTVNNAQGGISPATYILNDTNMTCSQIVYQLVQPGTRVVIDGVVCGG